MSHRIMYMGQKPLGEICYRHLLERLGNQLSLAAVVSNSSSDVWWGTNGVFEHARTHAIPAIDNSQRHTETIGDLIRSLEVDTILCVQHPWIISAETLGLVNGHAFNIHCAKLPDYKGHNTCNHAILDAAQEYTVTLHRLIPEVDAGDIAYTETFGIGMNETALALYERAVEAGVRLFDRLVDALESSFDIPRTPIDGDGRFFDRHSIDEFKPIADISDSFEVDLKARACFFPDFGYAHHDFDGFRFYIVPGADPHRRLRLEGE